MTADSIFSGITTFAKLPWVQCLGKDKTVPFDVAFLGAPFVRTTFLLNTPRTYGTTGYRHILSPGSTFWTGRYPSRFAPSHSLRRLQCSPGG